MFVVTQEVRPWSKGNSAKKFFQSKLRDKGLLWDSKEVGVFGLRDTSMIGKHKGLLNG